eukprot:Skav210545  [mRNA]  locus=scaffold1646:29944:30719:+ [translate_table: standard]
MTSLRSHGGMSLRVPRLLRLDSAHGPPCPDCGPPASPRLGFSVCTMWQEERKNRETKGNGEKCFDVGKQGFASNLVLKSPKMTREAEQKAKELQDADPNPSESYAVCIFLYVTYFFAFATQDLQPGQADWGEDSLVLRFKVQRSAAALCKGCCRVCVYLEEVPGLLVLGWHWC